VNPFFSYQADFDWRYGNDGREGRRRPESSDVVGVEPHGAGERQILKSIKAVPLSIPAERNEPEKSDSSLGVQTTLL
jgi:hypothetical protein